MRMGKFKGIIEGPMYCNELMDKAQDKISTSLSIRDIVSGANPDNFGLSSTDLCTIIKDLQFKLDATKLKRDEWKRKYQEEKDKNKIVYDLATQVSDRVSAAVKYEIARNLRNLNLTFKIEEEDE